MRRNNFVPQFTYLFYDLETSGLSPEFDQILQFAAVRLDRNFQELERHNIRIKLSVDVIPSPEALVVNRTSVELFNSGMTEYEGILKIYNLMNTPGTISIGFNSLSFDDEFLRFSFFRHLLPPYRHQFANNCSRMDIYPMVLLAYQIRPDLLRWPMHDNKNSFRLEHLVKENGCNTGESHDALVDVLDTIELAKLLRRDEAFWNEATDFFNKQKDKEFFTGDIRNYAIENTLCASAILVSKQTNTPPIIALHLGQHKIYENQMRWLKLDGILFSTLEMAEINTQVKVHRKKWGEPPFLFSDKDPRFIEKLSLDQRKMAEVNLIFLQKNPALFFAIKDYYLNETYPDYPNYDPNSGLYKLPFAKKSDQQALMQEEEIKNLCACFHILENAKKSEIIGKLDALGSIYATLAIRLMGREMLCDLSTGDKAAFQAYLARVFDSNVQSLIYDYRGQAKLSLREAISNTEKLLLSVKTEEERNFLANLKSWYVSHANKYTMPQIADDDVDLQAELAALLAPADAPASRKRPREETPVETPHNARSHSVLFTNATPNRTVVKLEMPSTHHEAQP